MKAIFSKFVIVIGGILFYFIIGMNFVKLLLFVIGRLLGITEEIANNPFFSLSVMIISPLLGAGISYNMIGKVMRNKKILNLSSPSSSEYANEVLHVLKKTYIVLLILIYLLNTKNFLNLFQ